ncbi:uncharacterized protein F5147DRAFT_649088 [Suillus discolor]|uniref:Uncharacterized protein n=1 Tax=Suillus discolor TaxID=1912936 RepID=A0A9P7FF82_9AGAM|nr:uncharacterized protein F5147DRAFT_649088 [Suillus discolor]KAG2116626.1 hypothetical protein F5147DRAFT_649088 [Suillus discolor]
MTISYLLCVFLESREERLSPEHCFYRIVEETIQNVIHCPTVLHYMVRSTLKNFNEVVEEQRVQDITKYLQTTCPTVSGSDSPAMNSTFVDVRAYSACQGGKDPKSRKLARKHIYIQKRLVDDWVKALTNKIEYCPSEREFWLLTVFMKLCLICGLIAVVKLAFTSQDIDVKYQAHGSPCSLANFLLQWNGWLEFDSDEPVHRERLPYHKLRSIVFSDMSELSPNHGHIRIKDNFSNIELMAAGNWTTIPPVWPTPYNESQPHCLCMWDSPPTEGHPATIEMTPWKSDTRRSDRGWIYGAKQVED